MRQRYDQFSCFVECPLRFKVNICQKTELIEVYHERIEQMEERMRKNVYSPYLADEDFFFNAK